MTDFVAFLERAERSPATIRNYACDLRFESVNGEEFALSKITPTDLREYKRYLVADRRLKPNSTNRHLATLRCFLKWAAECGNVSDARALKVPAFEREVRSGPRWLDRRERFALVRAVEQGESARDAAIVKVLLNTGLRVQEMCSLEWHDVTMTERKGVLTVRRGS